MSTDTETKMVDAAKELASRGWRVLPLRAKGKVPLIEAWQNAASNVPETLDHWWSMWHDANVGVQLGPRSGIIDIECDTKEAEHALAELFAGNMPVVPTFQASRGKHRLFRWSDDLPAQAVVKFKLHEADPEAHTIEIRLGGGKLGAQSVFPPSKHATGSTYRWLVHPDDAELIELPVDVKLKVLSWIGRKGKTEPHNAGPSTAVPTADLDGDDISEAFASATDLATRNETVDVKAKHRATVAYLATMDGAQEGNRNKRLYDVACVLVRDFDHDRSEALKRLVEFNDKNNTPPLPPEEVRRVLRNAMKYARGEPGSKLRFDRQDREKEIAKLSKLMSVSGATLVDVKRLGARGVANPRYVLVFEYGGNRVEVDMGGPSQFLNFNKVRQTLFGALDHRGLFKGVTGKEEDGDKTPWTAVAERLSKVATPESTSSDVAETLSWIADLVNDGHFRGVEPTKDTPSGYVRGYMEKLGGAQPESFVTKDSHAYVKLAALIQHVRKNFGKVDGQKEMAARLRLAGYADTVVQGVWDVNAGNTREEKPADEKAFAGRYWFGPYRRD